MKAAPFDYIRPDSVTEASAALSRPGVTAAVIAGGQSLLPMLNLRAVYVDVLVDISRLDELKEIGQSSAGLQIGALVRHAAIEDGEIPDLFGGLLSRVASKISYRAVRNYGTIGGSVALADPAADWPGCLIALGASVRLSGPSGARSQRVADFLQGPYATSLAPGEIIVGFELPRPDKGIRWGCAKVARKSGAFADSIAFAVGQGNGGPATVVLAGGIPRASALPSTSKLASSATTSEIQLRTAISDDLSGIAPEADGYQRRLHTATILRAIKDMRSQ